MASRSLLGAAPRARAPTPTPPTASAVGGDGKSMPIRHSKRHQETRHGHAPKVCQASVIADCAPGEEERIELRRTDRRPWTCLSRKGGSWGRSVPTCEMRPGWLRGRHEPSASGLRFDHHEGGGAEREPLGSAWRPIRNRHRRARWQNDLSRCPSVWIRGARRACTAAGGLRISRHLGNSSAPEMGCRSCSDGWSLGR